MSLTSAEVKKIAHLARLSIDETEILSLTKDLDNILNLVGKMNGIDISQVEPMAHPLETSQPLRVDSVTEKTDQRELYLQNAPQTLMGLFIVPPVLDLE
jgi:aspartyl-tRNA(Asn)/glutamyl-tRNA(Gln) amidotransferase subunit C